MNIKKEKHAPWKARSLEEPLVTTAAVFRSTGLLHFHLSQDYLIKYCIVKQSYKPRSIKESLLYFPENISNVYWRQHHLQDDSLYLLW